jgi:hypothetical protein
MAGNSFLAVGWLVYGLEMSAILGVLQTRYPLTDYHTRNARHGRTARLDGARIRLSIVQRHSHLTCLVGEKGELHFLVQAIHQLGK